MEFPKKPCMAPNLQSGSGRLACFAGPCRRLLRVVISSAMAAVAPASDADAGDELRNWFNDPFFQISNGMQGCPTPAGPFVTERERHAQAHRRAEKGTSCWLARDCDRPNAYAYDPDIAAAMQSVVERDKPFPGTSLWTTVQGRVVYIEGCVASPSQVAEIEAFARAQPYVEQVHVSVRTSRTARAPYRLRTER